MARFSEVYNVWNEMHTPKDDIGSPISHDPPPLSWMIEDDKRCAERIN